MNTLQCLSCRAVIASLASAPAASEYSLEAEALKLYGGAYSTDCGNPPARHFRVAETLNHHRNAACTWASARLFHRGSHLFKLVQAR
jgi:hypothetical protein